MRTKEEVLKELKEDPRGEKTAIIGLELEALLDIRDAIVELFKKKTIESPKASK